MATFAFAPEDVSISTDEAISREARAGLTATPKTLSPWLFYDEAGSRLFEQITELPEYYLTRTERSIFAAHADEILSEAARGQGPAGKLTFIELGAGTATKTGILLAAAVRQQGSVVYQPVDVSESALAEASENILNNIPGVTVRSQVTDYTRAGASIGSPAQYPHARALHRLQHRQLHPRRRHGGSAQSSRAAVARRYAAARHGPRPHASAEKHKTEATLLAAYDDAAGTTAAFNLNVLTRLNRDLGSDFNPEKFRHKVLWNPAESRIEMHLESLTAQRVHLPANEFGPALTINFAAGETIHTENSYKFTPAVVQSLLASANFKATRSWQDPQHLFAVTLATAL